MEEREGRISLKIDLTTGTIELDAPADSFNEAIEKTKELAATLDLRNRSASTVPERTVPPSSPIALAAEASSASLPSPAARAARPKSGKSSGRAGRLGSYEPIPQLLTEDQEIELRAFIAEKNPTDQADRVLTAMVKGEQILGRKALIYNEIYTMMWLGGIKDLPKALDVVLGKMVQDQWIIRDGGGFSAKFIGRNRVENDLPRKESN